MPRPVTPHNLRQSLARLTKKLPSSARRSPRLVSRLRRTRGDTEQRCCVAFANGPGRLMN